MSQQSHRSDSRILNRRTLERDHRRLAEVLDPGLRVLDVGCGTGAITAGIARAVGPDGSVTGLDQDGSLLQEARSSFGAIPNLRFVEGNILEMSFSEEFDVVSAARTLQWIATPLDALQAMRRAAKRSGWIVAMDYSHASISWEPQPPPAFQEFYQAFLDWRTANGWDNELATKLSGLFRQTGLREIEVFVEDEITTRGDPAFAEVSQLWPHVIESGGPRIVEAGFLQDAQRRSAAEAMASWCAEDLQRQTMVARAVRRRVE